MSAGSKRCQHVYKYLGCPAGIVQQDPRARANVVDSMQIIGDVKGKECDYRWYGLTPPVLSPRLIMSWRMPAPSLFVPVLLTAWWADLPAKGSEFRGPGRNRILIPSLFQPLRQSKATVCSSDVRRPSRGLWIMRVSVLNIWYNISII